MQTSRLSSDEYATLVEQSPILIWRADLSMGCDYFNERWLAFTGRTMEQEYGNGWAEGVHPDDLDRCLQIYTTHFAKRESFEMEYRLRRADGEHRWLLDRGSPFHAPDGTFLGFIGSCVDVTDRIAAQEELARMHEKELDELRGVIPICAYCRKVRDDRNYWQQLDAFLAKHSKTEFSHGICPECKERLLTK